MVCSSNGVQKNSQRRRSLQFMKHTCCRFINGISAKRKLCYKKRVNSYFNISAQDWSTGICKALCGIHGKVCFLPYIKQPLFCDSVAENQNGQQALWRHHSHIEFHGNFLPDTRMYVKSPIYDVCVKKALSWHRMAERWNCSTAFSASFGRLILNLPNDLGHNTRPQRQTDIAFT